MFESIDESLGCAMEESARQRVGVVAVDPMRAVGLESILEEITGLEIVLLRLEELVSHLRKLQALVLDARAAGAGLNDLLARLRREAPMLRVIVVGESVDQKYVQTIIGTGARGYLLETASEAEFRMAMEVVLDGSVWAPRKVLARLIDAGGVQGSGAGVAEPVASLMTPREKEVLHLLKDGRTNRDIAKLLGIDETTVKAHLGRMLRKSGSANRVELTLRAMEQEQVTS
ncbi:MAG: response regulator transcription factor [Acidobacteriaceae bacterium]|nr:response regulator transcription factor [Acidobacteriaceae bacterium]